MVVFLLIVALLLGWLSPTNGSPISRLVPLIEELRSRKAPPCPCDDASLCNPIKKNVTQELIGFTANVDRSVYEKYDWDHLTTLMVTDCTELLSSTNCTSWDPQIVCYAHQRGVRVIRWPIHGYSKEILVNYTARDLWIKEQAQIVIDNYWDGVNLDWELAMSASDSKSQLLLTEFVNDVVTVFRIIFPDSKISFDAPFAPRYPGPNNTVGKECVFDRCFDYAQLASILDYIFIMEYDVYDWNLAQCTAVANSPLPFIANGVKQYVTLGIDPRKLVLGFPWYGYFYKYCIEAPNTTHCPLPYDDKAHCMVDHSRYEVMYSRIWTSFFPIMEAAGGGQSWDSASGSPYLWWYDTTHVNLHHLWYDDPKSLSLKIASVESLPVAVLGIGIFALSEIDNSNATQVNDMWAPFVQYIENKK